MLKTIHALFVCLFFAIIGTLFCAWNFHFFYLLFPQHSYHKSNLNETLLEQKKIPFFIPNPQSNTSLEQCTITLAWHAKQQEKNLKLLTDKWFFLAQEAECIDKNIKLELVIFDTQTKTVYLYFSKTIFKKKQSLFFTRQLMTSLTRSICTSIPEVQKISLLVKNKPLIHPLLDFSLPVACNTWIE